MRSPSNKLSSMGRLSKGLALLLGATAVIVACLGTSGSPADDVPTATATAVIQPPREKPRAALHSRRMARHSRRR